MSKVIDFKTPAQLRDELAAKDLECQILQAKLSKVNGVNEMLKMQILDLLEQLNTTTGHFDLIKQNLLNLQAKLPQLD